VPYTKPDPNVIFIIVLSYNLIFFRGFNTRYGRYSVNEIIRKNASSYINKYHTCLILQAEKVAQKIPLLATRLLLTEILRHLGGTGA